MPRGRGWAVLVAGIGSAAVLGASRSFTLAADIETAAAMVLVLVAGLALRPSVPPAAVGGPAAPRAGSGRPGAPPARTGPPARRLGGRGGAVARRHGRSDRPGAAPVTGRTAAWVALIAVVVAWELWCYVAGFGGHRGAYPTLSSMETAVTRTWAGRSAVAFAWLVLGWRLVRR